MNKKGFTLIELLAVIVILAVISTIAVPIIINVVNNSRESGRMQSVNGIINATNLYTVEAMMGEGKSVSGNLFDVISEKVDGKKPESGEIFIGEDNKIALALKYDDYCYIKQYDGEIVKTEAEECTLTVALEDVKYNVTYDDIYINYEQCFTIFSEEGLSDKDADIFCKGGKTEDGLDFKKFIEEAELGPNPVTTLISLGLIDYNINYDNCVVQLGVILDDLTDTVCKGETDETGRKYMDAFIESMQEVTNALTYEWLIQYNIISIKTVPKTEEKSCYEYTKLEDETLQIIRYNCIRENAYNLPIITDVTIPQKIDGFDVSMLGEGVFNNTGITSVDLSYSKKLTKLEGEVFANNRTLSTIKIPSNITTIGENEFANYLGLTEVIIDNSKGSINGEPWKLGVGTKIKYLKNNEIVNIPETTILEKAKELVYTNNTCDSTKSYTYMGGCYLKANANKELKNHIWYNGFLWRIMGINSDGTVRMITEENVSSLNYGSSTTFIDSYADEWLNEYFYNKLSNENGLRDIITINNNVPYFCSGNTTSTSSTNTTCNDIPITRKVGLISLDEFNLAGGFNSYLNTTQSFLTMTKETPTEERITGVYVVYDSVSTALAMDAIAGLRPVINVNPNTLITSGTGTLNNFYVLKEYKGSKNVTGTLAKAKIGEYVKFNNKNYRVVENGETTKLILDEYGYFEYEYIGHNSVINVLNSIGLDYLTEGKDKEKLQSSILTGKWYRNTYTGGSYEIPLNEEGVTPLELKVGLIRVGEMLSGQSYSILTNNGTEISNKSNAKIYSTMTTIDSELYDWWGIVENGIMEVTSSMILDLGRPVINISSEYNLISGNGTLGNEYIIEIE